MAQSENTAWCAVVCVGVYTKRDERDCDVRKYVCMFIQFTYICSICNEILFKLWKLGRTARMRRCSARESRVDKSKW
jgi:hypothetical protein